MKPVSKPVVFPINKQRLTLPEKHRLSLKQNKTKQNSVGFLPAGQSKKPTRWKG